MEDWIWAQLQEARTQVRSVLDLRPSKVDLCTQLPPDAQLGGGAEEREEAEDRCREELQAVLAEHCRAKAELAQLQQSYNGQCQALRAESAAAHPGVVTYMERAQVALQPIRLGGEQFAMRRRATSRSKALSRQADIQAWIQETLARLLPGVAGSQQLTPEQQATCVADLREALVHGLPRTQGMHVSLLSRPGPK